jgi:hypothetical protein
MIHDAAMRAIDSFVAAPAGNGHFFPMGTRIIAN